MPPFETRSSQFGLISGIRQPNSDMLLEAAPAGLFTPESRKGQLYIVAEADQDVARGRDACQLVIHTIRKLFYDDSSFSITSALRKAISAANKALYEQNFSASPQKRAVVGVSCAVVKGNDLYIAQIQPAQAYVLAGGKLRALPSIPAWGSAPDFPTFFKPSAIGASLSIEPEFYRAVLNVGDTLLICTSNLTRLIGPNEATRLLRAVLLEEIADGVADICAEHQITEAHGLIVGVRAALSPAAQADPLSRAGITERGRLALRRAGGWVGRITSTTALRLQGPATRAQQQRTESRLQRTHREQDRLSEMQAEPPYTTAQLPRPHPLDLGEQIDERIEQERRARRDRLGAAPLRPADTNDTPPSSFLGEGDYLASPSERRIDLSDTPSMAALGKRSNPYGRPRIEPTLGERLTQPIAQLANAFTSMSRRRRLRRPPPRALPRYRRAGLSYRRQGPPFPWIWLLVLILVIAAAVLYGINLSREIAVRQVNDSLDRAATAIAALRTADASSAQSKLDTAALALADVRATGALTETLESRQRYEEMQREYERALAATQKLTYFDDLTVLASHPIVGGLFSSVVVPPPPQGITNTATFAHIYLLDGNAGVLYRMLRTGGPIEPILRPEDIIGPSVVGKVKAQAWREDNIVAVAQSGDAGPFTFYFRNGDSWGYNTLAGSETWGRVDEHFRAANYGGNLYIWGAGTAPDQIQKYLSGNYGQFPDPWIKDYGGQKADSVIDLAIDGNVYLLKADSHILVFEGGAFKREIVPQGVNPPQITPASFFVTGDPDNGAIFLIDYNQRILEIDKQTGALIQQIRARPDSPYHLDQVTSMYVDSAGARPVLYLVNGSQILRATLPNRPRPLTEPSAPTSTGTTTPGSATTEPAPTSAP
jgi:hypothetical protein